MNQERKLNVSRFSGSRIPNAIFGTENLAIRHLLGPKHHDLGANTCISRGLYYFCRASSYSNTARSLRKLVQ